MTRVVLVHGNASSSAAWTRVVERLGDAPRIGAVEVPDRPVFGGAPELAPDAVARALRSVPPAAT